MDLYSHLNFPLVSQTEEWKKKIQTRGVRWGPSADNSLPLAQKHTSAFTYVHYFTFEDCCKYFTMINNSKLWGFFPVQIIASKRLTEDQGFQVFCLFLCFLLLFMSILATFVFTPISRLLLQRTSEESQNLEVEKQPQTWALSTRLSSSCLNSLLYEGLLSGAWCYLGSEEWCWQQWPLANILDNLKAQMRFECKPLAMISSEHSSSRS